MGKDKAEKKERKEKKEKKSSEHKIKKDKKEKAPTVSNGEAVAEAVLDVVMGDGDSKIDGDFTLRPAPPISALVPFANPLADEKVGKKVLKGVKKAAKNKSLRRGVKEVVKAIRKSSKPSGSSTTPSVSNIVILAADISPMDVISHIPVLCEDHSLPYLFVPSRAELGIAGGTKRPTSVVLISKDRVTKKKAENAEEETEYHESFGDLAKVVEKETRKVRI